MAISGWLQAWDQAGKDKLAEEAAKRQVVLEDYRLRDARRPEEFRTALGSGTSSDNMERMFPVMYKAHQQSQLTHDVARQNLEAAKAAAAFESATRQREEDARKASAEGNLTLAVQLNPSVYGPLQAQGAKQERENLTLRHRQNAILISEALEGAPSETVILRWNAQNPDRKMRSYAPPDGEGNTIVTWRNGVTTRVNLRDMYARQAQAGGIPGIKSPEQMIQEIALARAKAEGKGVRAYTDVYSLENPGQVERIPSMEARGRERYIHGMAQKAKGDDVRKFADDIEKIRVLRRFIIKAHENPEFFGQFGFSKIKRFLGDTGYGTEEHEKLADFWSKYEKSQFDEIHELFGAAFTAPEQKRWEATAARSGQSQRVALANMISRYTIMRDHAKNVIELFKTGRANEDQVAAAQRFLDGVMELPPHLSVSDGVHFLGDPIGQGQDDSSSHQPGVSDVLKVARERDIPLPVQTEDWTAVLQRRSPVRIDDLQVSPGLGGGRP